MPRRKTTDLTKHRAPWLKKELAEIKRPVKANTPLAGISQALGRSEAAVRYRASLEGISLRSKKRPAAAR